MIRSCRTLQRLGISRLLFRAHGAGIKLNPRRHFSSRRLFPDPLFPADTSGALSIPLPRQPPRGSVCSLSPALPGLLFVRLAKGPRQPQPRGQGRRRWLVGEKRGGGSLRGCGGIAGRDEPGGRPGRSGGGGGARGWRGSGREGGRGVRRGGLVGRRGPAFPLRIPGAMRGGDGPEPAGLAP